MNPNSKWNIVRRRKSSLSRVAAFDKSKADVIESDNIEELVEQLSSEIQPARERAVFELVRAGILALDFLPRVCSLLTHELWTRRLTGVEALGSIALAEPTRDRLAQAYERLRIVDAEINATSSRYFRLNHKRARRKEERIELAAGLIAMGESPPPGVSAELYSEDEEDEDDGYESSSIESIKPVSDSQNGLGSLLNNNHKKDTGEVHHNQETSEHKKPGELHQNQQQHQHRKKKKKKSEMERAQDLFIDAQKRLSETAMKAETGFKQEMETIKTSMLLLSLERMKTRDEIRILDETVVAARREAMGHGREVVYLLDDPRSPAALREAALRTITVLDGINGGGRAQTATPMSANSTNGTKLLQRNLSKDRTDSNTPVMTNSSSSSSTSSSTSSSASSSVPSSASSVQNMSEEHKPKISIATKFPFQSNDIKSGENDDNNLSLESDIDIEVLSAMKRRIEDDDWTVRKMAIEGLELALGPAAPDADDLDETENSATVTTFGSPMSNSTFGGGSPSLSVSSPFSSNSRRASYQSPGEHASMVTRDGGWRLQALRKIVLLEEVPDVKQVAIKYLAEALNAVSSIQAPLLPRIALLLSNPNAGLRAASAFYLGRVGRLQHEKWELLARAWDLEHARRLRTMKTRRQKRIPGSFGALDDDDEMPRPLEPLMSPYVLALVRALKDPVQSVRDASVNAIGELRGKLAAFMGAPVLSRGLVPASALRRVCHDTSEKLRKGRRRKKLKGIQRFQAAGNTVKVSVKVVQNMERKVHEMEMNGIPLGSRVNSLNTMTSSEENDRGGGDDRDEISSEESGSVRRKSFTNDILSSVHQKMNQEGMGENINGEEYSEATIIKQLSQEHADELEAEGLAILKSQKNSNHPTSPNSNGNDDDYQYDDEKYDHIKYGDEEDEYDDDGEGEDDESLMDETEILRRLQKQKEDEEAEARKNEKIEYLSMGPALVADRRGEVRAAACCALGMLGAGSLVRGELRGGSGNKAPDEWVFDQDRHSAKMNAIVDEKMAKARALRVKARRIAVASGLKHHIAAAAVIGSGGSSGDAAVDIAEKHAVDAENRAAIAVKNAKAPYESPSEVALLKAESNIGNMLFEIARMDADASVRIAAREALYRLGISKVFSPALMKILATHESPEERARAAEQLGKLGSIHEDDGSDMVNGKTNNLNEGGSSGAKKQHQVAPGEGRELALVLSNAMRDKDWPVRTAAVRAMRLLGTEACLPHFSQILTMLGDASSEVREEACLCVGTGGAPKLKHADGVLPLLNDVDDDVRSAAATALGWMIHEEDDGLHHIVKDCVKELRKEAMFELSIAEATKKQKLLKKNNDLYLPHENSNKNSNQSRKKSDLQLDKVSSGGGEQGSEPNYVKIILSPLTSLLKLVLASLYQRLMDDSDTVRLAAVESLAYSPSAAYFIMTQTGDMIIDYQISAASRLSGLDLINKLPPALLLPIVPRLLPILRQAAGDQDRLIREAATEAIRRLSPLRKQSLRAAKVAEQFYEQAHHQVLNDHSGGTIHVDQSSSSSSSSSTPSTAIKELGHGVGGGGLDELRVSLSEFRDASQMFDPKRPWRKLATHPVNLVRSLHEEHRRGLISEDDMHVMIEKIKHNLEIANNAARVVNEAVRETGGVLAPHKTGEPITRLCGEVHDAGVEQRDIAETTSAEALDFRSVRGASEFLRWDKQDQRNRDKHGGGEWDNKEEPWGEGEYYDDDDEWSGDDEDSDDENT